jgi:hypothetical protein
MLPVALGKVHVLHQRVIGVELDGVAAIPVFNDAVHKRVVFACQEAADVGQLVKVGLAAKFAA